MARRRRRHLAVRPADRAGRRPGAGHRVLAQRRRRRRPAAGAAHPRAGDPDRPAAAGPAQLRRRRAVPRRALRRLAAEPVDDDGRRVDRAGHHHARSGRRWPPGSPACGCPPPVWWGLALAVLGAGADRRGRRHGQPARRWPATGWRCSARSAPAATCSPARGPGERLATSAYAVVCYSTCARRPRGRGADRRRAAGRVQRPRLVADRRDHRSSPSCSGTRCSTWCSRRSGRRWSASPSCSRCRAR